MKRPLLVFSFFICSLQLQAQIITTIAGSGAPDDSGDGGNATNAGLGLPTGITIDKNGNIYMSYFGHYAIRKINPGGIITTIAGNNIPGYSGDGGPATMAQIEVGEYLATDTAGNLYMSDNMHNVVRKVDAFGIISTFAGNGTSGYSGDNEPATNAQLNYPAGIATDNAGNVFIVDGLNNAIRKVSPTGIISTIAGNSIGANTGDGGPASAACLGTSGGIAIDYSGNMYIACYEVIRKINTTGIISTFTAGIEYDAVLTTDYNGNLFVSNSANEKVRRISASGSISNFAGNGYLGMSGHGGFSGDGGPAIAAELNGPTGIAVDTQGNVYIADSWNFRIRKVTSVASGLINIQPQTVRPKVFPNPAKSTFTVFFNGMKINTITVSDIFGKVIETKTFENNNAQCCGFNENGNLISGTYLLKIVSDAGTFYDKVIIP